MNKKGFMMAEVVVVSAIVMVAVTGLYTSYGKIYSTYNTRVKYYDTDTLYRLGYYRDFLIENTNSSGKKLINHYISLANTNKIEKISLNEYTNNAALSSDRKENVYLIYKPNENLNSNNFTNINATFKDYIEFIKKSEKFNANYIMLMESCNKNDINDCTYTYLEVYNEQ